MVSRRKFIQQSGLMTAGLMIHPVLPHMQKYKLGLQLYTIRAAIEKDIRSAFQTISSYGYRQVETYGYNYGNNKGYWNYDPKDAVKLLSEFNLTTPSGHYDLDKFFLKNAGEDEWKKYVDSCIEGALIMKQEYIVWPWLAPENRSIEMFHRLAERLNRIGEPIKKAGLQLAYHNHDFEFIDHDGKIGYDIVLNETDANLVKLEADLYWMSRASKLTSQEWFARQPGRFVCWHIKDMDKTNHDLHVPVGDGMIDFSTILKDSSLAGAKYLYVEQGNNYVPDDLSCVGKSARYMKSNLLK
jgi:sugar phosphate isomerase/epimerase